MQDLRRLAQLEMGLMGRRLRGMAMISRGIVPDLIISQRMVDRVVEAAAHFLADETGETLVGLVVDHRDVPESMPTLYVLDTIAPDETTIRRSHMFEQGDDLQGDIFVWLMENWQTYLELGRDVSGRRVREEWKQPLRHLGDWHKQPGYMIQPSGGDLMTALRVMDDEENDFEFLLVPIVTLGHDSVTSEEGSVVNYFTVPMDDGTSLRMDWWYIHRDVRIFQPITPRVVGYEDLPELTPYPWYVLDQDLLDEELALMEDDGLFLIGSTTILWEVDGKPPLEICMIVGRAGSSEVLLIVTDWNYPDARPQARIAPFKGIDTSMYIYDIFAQLWDNSREVPDPPGFTWQADSYLVDYIAAIETQMGTRPPAAEVVRRGRGSAAESANPGVVRIEVSLDDAAPTPAKPEPKTQPSNTEDDAS